VEVNIGMEKCLQLRYEAFATVQQVMSTCIENEITIDTSTSLVVWEANITNEKHLQFWHAAIQQVMPIATPTAQPIIRTKMLHTGINDVPAVITIQQDCVSPSEDWLTGSQDC
jgi:hypothetical protein